MASCRRGESCFLLLRLVSMGMMFPRKTWGDFVNVLKIDARAGTPDIKFVSVVFSDD